MKTTYVITHNGVYRCEYENPADFDAFNWEHFTMDFARLNSYEAAACWLAKTSAEHLAEGQRLAQMGEEWEDDVYFNNAQGTVWKKTVVWMAGHRWCAGRVYENAAKNFRIYPMYANELRDLEREGWTYSNSRPHEAPPVWEDEGYISPSDEFVPPIVEG